jgi:meso-butanediol dehydrogenase / (S,S)-butanediol dehydrogenase / diacetyl reductase
MRRLENKVALITGGGTGIGAGIAKRFVEEGARVCIAGRRIDKLEEVIAALPKDSAIACASDVSNEEDAKRMVETTLSLGGLDILVNNGAINFRSPVDELSLKDWQSVINVNLTGPFLTMHYAIPHMMRKGKGSIINIASVGGIRSIPTDPSYCASKSGLIGLSQQVAIDYGEKGIRCNVVCPGLVHTAMTDGGMDLKAQSINSSREEAYAFAVRNIPLRKSAYPHEIAPLCAYLASDEATFMTGSVLVIDGGISPLDAGMVMS